MLEIHPTVGRMRPGRARAASPDQETHGQRDEHQHDQRPRDLHRVDRDSLEEERQSEGQVAHGDDHQQHHQAHREGQIGLGELRELDQKRRPRRQPAQQQADPQRLVETEHPPEPERYQGRQDEVRREGQHHQPGVLERGQDLADGQTQANTERARHDEDDDGHARAPDQQVGQRHRCRLSSLHLRNGQSASAALAALDIANSQRRAHSTVTGDVWVPLACCGTSRRTRSACHHGSRGTSSGGCWNVISWWRGCARGCEGCRCRRTGW